ncbi:hypothetical protein AVEN_216031-1, partial [Araneus ventricosus]
MKSRFPSEVKRHSIDEWPKLKTPELLSEKLEQYENEQNIMKRKTSFHDHKDKYYSFEEKNSAYVG